jgi:hypothetical protein
MEKEPIYSVSEITRELRDLVERACIAAQHRGISASGL